ncbi:MULTISPECIES: biopolymer transporter ExbD [Asticcacaulis]|uniref:ExbD/TolR family protein n=1 Tax=Asticcacaulis TaxID=76890 RepID=UPI001AE511AD|nr:MULTISPECIES: biopolymer transporter ExbD [Asticcacaulis]MBP2157607.1 biopolymer transport protein ExbD [Asticcacaulis solisilvae]MDR6798652.1 biopolymer transport protein ExbD [Asticcacaulis sp. BE141]
MLLRSLTVIAAALLLSGCNSLAIPADKQLEGTQGDTRLVEMLPDGRMRIGDRLTTPEALVADLRSAMGERKPEDMRILIQSSSDVPYDRFQTVLKILQDAGFTRVGLVTAGLISEQ